MFEIKKRNALSGAYSEQPHVINAPLVVSETIDGEAIIMHHGTGRYFDIRDSGALIWSAIETGAAPAQISAHLAAAYGLAAAEASDMVDAFIQTLLANDLVRADPEVVPGPLPASLPVTAPFQPPVLGVHDDLADMLLLDPIHDVDEVGWPAPRSPDASA